MVVESVTDVWLDKLNIAVSSKYPNSSDEIADHPRIRQLADLYEKCLLRKAHIQENSLC